MIIRSKKYEGISITTSVEVHAIFAALLKQKPKFERDKEHLWVAGLNRRNRIIYIDLVSVGSTHGTIAEAREIFRMAIHKSASSIVLVHNHPSGNREPSPQDKVITTKIKEAGKVLGIELLDHVIITPTEYYSFKDEG
ncbi:MAG: JAB domain-containing protein [Bacteroidia bacterium]